MLKWEAICFRHHMWFRALSLLWVKLFPPFETFTLHCLEIVLQINYWVPQILNIRGTFCTICIKEQSLHVHFMIYSLFPYFVKKGKIFALEKAFRYIIFVWNIYFLKIYFRLCKNHRLCTNHMSISKKPGPIASDFSQTFCDFGIRSKLIFFSYTPGEFYSWKCMVWKKVMKIWLVMVTRIKLTE